MFDLAEIFLAKTEQRCAVKFCVAANVVVCVRMEFFAFFVAPEFLGVVSTVQVDGLRVPVGLLARDVAAAFDQQNSLARRCQSVGESAATCSGPDNNDVIVVRCAHGLPFTSDRNVVILSFTGLVELRAAPLRRIVRCLLTIVEPMMV